MAKVDIRPQRSLTHIRTSLGITGKEQLQNGITVVVAIVVTVVIDSVVAVDVATAAVVTVFVIVFAVVIVGSISEERALDAQGLPLIEDEPELVANQVEPVHMIFHVS